MKTLRLITLILVVTSILISCGNIKNKIEDSAKEAIEEVAKDLKENQNSFNTIQINNLYSIDVPDFLVKTNSLNDEASLQYENTAKEYYVIVIDEAKHDFLEALNNELNEDEAYTIEEVLEPYSYLQFTTFANEDQYYDFEYIDVNGLNGQQLDITNYFESLNVFYKMACIEGNDNLYFVVTWTLDSYKDKHNDSMQKIIDSFKEI
ncbi:MAG TPA: hypothetical protein PLO05_00180 [Bacteroidales bacterium]|nr:hypothetical protein [Bacteroidales bacterium]